MQHCITVTRTHNKKLNSMHIIFKNSIHVRVITACWIHMKYYSQTQHFRICHPTVKVLVQRPTIRHLLTPWCRVLLEKLTGLQLVKKFPAFHGTRRFTTALTSVRHLSLSWASPIQSIYPHRTSWRSILILSTHLCLGLSSGLFPSSFPRHYFTKIKKTSLHLQYAFLDGKISIATNIF